MGDKTLPVDRRDVRYRALADPTRRHLLRILDDATDALALDTLTARVGLHVNTIRGHLDVLEEAALVVRTTVRRTTPGRPRVAFQAVAREAWSPSSEGYRFLAEVLAGSIQATSAAPAHTAREAGRLWGRQLARPRGSGTAVAPDEAMEQVVSTFAELGFAPEPVTSDGMTDIRLHDCPFRELAKTKGEVVCSVHEGLLAGMLEEMGGRVGVDTLEPFVEPSLCVARVSKR